MLLLYHVQLHLATPVDYSAEQYILNWAHDESNKKTIFLLGDFGDGKTFLTYSVARRLLEEFSISPATGVIPLRLTLRDLRGDDFEDFLEKRLKTFKANIDEWNEIKRKHSILVILDGFDEMSISMDPLTLKANADRLLECLRNLNGIKVMITSRSPAFKKIKTELLQWIEPHEILCLEPLDYRNKEEHIRKFAADNYVPTDRLEKFIKTPDLMGLASKPLFLEMLKDALLDGKLEKTDSLTVYRRYVEKILDRKVEFLIKHKNMNLVPKAKTLTQVKLLMEDFALLCFERGTKNENDAQREISLSEFKMYQNDKELVERLWEGLTSPTPLDIIDADNRFTSRSLLKATEKGYIFCHRSIQEYFVAGVSAGCCKNHRMR